MNRCTSPPIFGNPLDDLNTALRHELRGPTINTADATFMAAIDDLPLPRGWTKAVRSSVLHAISVAFSAVTQAWASSATSRRSTTQLKAELDRTKTEIAMLNEELAIKNDRLSRVPPRRRPHYRATDRMRILQLKTARGWSTTQTASIFAVSEDTVATWLRRIDEEGDSALVQTAEPVNKFPEFVGYIVRRLKTLCPTMGKKRIAQTLARAGMHLGTTTVGRMLRHQPDRANADQQALTVEESTPANTLLAKQPNHIWHIDLTVVPTSSGFWVPWSPFSKLQRWPFCWWVAVVIDQMSRRVVGLALFKKAPTSPEICRFIDRAIKGVGTRPQHIVTDKGSQFFCKAFKSWCSSRSIRPRFGAFGKHASIAIVERFIRSMKSECTRRVLVPMRLDMMRAELCYYANWYNDHRPHQALHGRTPTEVYMGLSNEALSIEPRQLWPIREECVRTKRVDLALKFVEGRRHLPIVELKRAA